MSDVILPSPVQSITFLRRQAHCDCAQSRLQTQPTGLLELGPVVHMQPLGEREVHPEL